GYFRAASGPFAPYLRSMIPDADARKLLSRGEDGLPVGLREQWREDLERYANHYNFDADQRAEAEAALEESLVTADAWFRDRDNARNIEKYLDDLERVESLEADDEAMAFQAELAVKDRRALEQTRRELVAEIDAMTDALHGAWDEIAT